MIIPWNWRYHIFRRLTNHNWSTGQPAIFECWESHIDGGILAGHENRLPMKWE